MSQAMAGAAELAPASFALDDLEDTFKELDLAVEGGVGRVELTASAQVAQTGDACAQCAVPLVFSGESFRCPECGADFEAADIAEIIDTARAESRAPGGLAPPRSRLMVAGANSQRFQGSLASCSPVSTADQQQASLYRELTAWNRAFQGKGGNPFPNCVLMDVVVVYGQIQRQEVKRSNEKKAIIAAILYHACLHRGFRREPSDATRFVGLERCGLARGETYLRRAIQDGKVVGFELVNNPFKQILTTAFAGLGLQCAKNEQEPADQVVWDAVLEVFAVASRRNIAHQSEVKSKVHGALVSVLLRRPGGLGGATDPRAVLNRVSAVCNIRRYTLTNVLTEMYRYHSHFAAVFEKHGLKADKRGTGWVPPGKKKKKR